MNKRNCNSRSPFTKTIVFTITLAILIGNSGCANTPSVLVTPEPTAIPTIAIDPTPCLQKISELNFDTIASDTHSKMQEKQPEIYFITSHSEAVEIAKLLSNEDVAKKLQALNYDEEFAIAVFLGMKPTSGYKIIINHVLYANNEVNICATLLTPEPGKMITNLETYPYHLIQINNKEFSPGQEIFIHLIVDGQKINSITRILQ